MLVNLWNVDSFDKIATMYDCVKPLVSKCHTRDQDIRPIGDRARKHERIKKISDNCYVLMDGYYTGDDVFLSYYGSRKEGPTQAEVIKLAPIVWRKHKDGSETITVRNGSGNFSHCSRYAFLGRCLPRGLGFSVDSGKQYVHCAGERYYLAKSNTLAAHALPKGERSKWDKHYTTRDDGAALTFRIKDGEIRYDDGGKAKPTPPVKRIDTVAKNKMKPYLDKFQQWTFTMAPLWDYHSYDQATRVNKDVGAFLATYVYRAKDEFVNDPKLTKEIIKDEGHPLRVALGYTIMRNTHYEALIKQGLRRYSGYENVSESTVRAQYNAQINQVCGFIKIKKGKK